MTQENIRNFSIIAHIDHGKSTLADRFLELTGALSPRQMREQVLDDMEIEREKGITIKARSVQLSYKTGGRQYSLNLIDTPGHVDFAGEVSRSLSACDGAILLVDASKGVQAQTVANKRIAEESGLVIIPVINKIDLSDARPEETASQLMGIMDVELDDFIFVSARTGENVPMVLEAVIAKVPAPGGSVDAPLRAFVFDSAYDVYKGVIVFVRVVEGFIEQGMKIRFMGGDKVFVVSGVGVFRPLLQEVDKLTPGMVGYLFCNIKNIGEVSIGDTIINVERPAASALPGSRGIKPMVFSGFHPVNNDDFDQLEHAMKKLQLNDASFMYEREDSSSLGLGFRCGFLGLLHMEIVQERLEREYGMEVITTAPSTTYRITTKKGEVLEVDNMARFPDTKDTSVVEEPYISLLIVTPIEFLGAIMKLALSRRAVYKKTEYLDGGHITLSYEMPFSEIMADFYDKLKSVSGGYASMDYEYMGLRPSALVRLDILINGERLKCLSVVVPAADAQGRGRKLALAIKDALTSQMFAVVIQAAVGGNVVARETKKAYRKDVTAKLYGGDVTRKRKLLEKQKKGKKRMKEVGKVSIPQEVFMSAIRAS